MPSSSDVRRLATEALGATGVPARCLRRWLVLTVCLWVVLLVCNHLFRFDIYKPSKLSPDAGTSLDQDEHAEPHFDEYLQLSYDQVPNFVIILYWTKYFHKYSVANIGDEEYLRARLRFRQVLKRPLLCYNKYPKCLITNDRAYLQRAAAIIFHWNNFDTTDLPPNVEPAIRHRQLWTLYNLEPPPVTNRLEEGAAGTEGFYFDLMANYRLDAQLHLPYARVVERDVASMMDIPSSLPDWTTKRKPIAWMVSNCRTQSRREEYVARLRELIEVDIFGRCGEHTCNRSKMYSCYLDMARDYYFYLSFENAFCKDYATEKIFNVLRHGLVPIVSGGANYTRILPPGSFIDASRMSPSQLARLLRAIMSDRARYESYFAWRAHYQVTAAPRDYNEHLYCQLCERLASGATTTNTARWTLSTANEHYLGNASCWAPTNLER